MKKKTYNNLKVVSYIENENGDKFKVGDEVLIHHYKGFTYKDKIKSIVTTDENTVLKCRGISINIDLIKNISHPY